MSQTIKRRASLAANGLINNLLTGEEGEFPGQDARVRVYAVASDPGAIELDVQFGNEVKGNALVLSDETTAGAGPMVPENLLVDDVALAGERLKLTLRNTTGGAVTYDVLVVIETP